MNTTQITPSGQITTFNREGRTIYFVQLSASAAAQFTAKSDHCIVVAEYNGSANNMGLQVPSGMNIGSVIEVYSKTSWGIDVKAPAGETILGYSDVRINEAEAVALTKVSSDLWVFAR